METLSPWALCSVPAAADVRGGLLMSQDEPLPRGNGPRPQLQGWSMAHADCEQGDGNGNPDSDSPTSCEDCPHSFHAPVSAFCLQSQDSDSQRESKCPNDCHLSASPTGASHRCTASCNSGSTPSAPVTPPVKMVLATSTPQSAAHRTSLSTQYSMLHSTSPACCVPYSSSLGSASLHTSSLSSPSHSLLPPSVLLATSSPTLHPRHSLPPSPSLPSLPQPLPPPLCSRGAHQSASSVPSNLCLLPHSAPLPLPLPLACSSGTPSVHPSPPPAPAPAPCFSPVTASAPSEALRPTAVGLTAVPVNCSSSCPPSPCGMSSMGTPPKWLGQSPGQGQGAEGRGGWVCPAMHASASLDEARVGHHSPWLHPSTLPPTLSPPTLPPSTLSPPTLPPSTLNPPTLPPSTLNPPTLSPLSADPSATASSASTQGSAGQEASPPGQEASHATPESAQHTPPHALKDLKRGSWNNVSATGASSSRLDCRRSPSEPPSRPHARSCSLLRPRSLAHPRRTALFLTPVSGSSASDGASADTPERGVPGVASTKAPGESDARGGGVGDQQRPRTVTLCHLSLYSPKSVGVTKSAERVPRAQVSSWGKDEAWVGDKEEGNTGGSGEKEGRGKGRGEEEGRRGGNAEDWEDGGKGEKGKGELHEDNARGGAGASVAWPSASDGLPRGSEAGLERYTGEQREALERAFRACRGCAPTREWREAVAKALQMHPRQVAIWCENRRVRWKRGREAKMREGSAAGVPSRHSSSPGAAPGSPSQGAGQGEGYTAGSPSPFLLDSPRRWGLSSPRAHQAALGSPRVHQGRAPGDRFTAGSPRRWAAGGPPQWGLDSPKRALESPRWALDSPRARQRPLESPSPKEPRGTGIAAGVPEGMPEGVPGGVPEGEAEGLPEGEAAQLKRVADWEGTVGEGEDGEKGEGLEGSKRKFKCGMPMDEGPAIDLQSSWQGRGGEAKDLSVTEL